MSCRAGTVAVQPCAWLARDSAWNVTEQRARRCATSGAHAPKRAAVALVRELREVNPNLAPLWNGPEPPSGHREGLSSAKQGDNGLGEALRGGRGRDPRQTDHGAHEDESPGGGNANSPPVVHGSAHEGIDSRLEFSCIRHG